MRLETLEIRWFGVAPAPIGSVPALFEDLAGYRPVPEAPRTDYYLRLPHGGEVGVKRREGRLEHKWLLDILPGIEGDSLAPAFHHWCKIAFDMDFDRHAIHDIDWIAVRKRRWISPWGWNGNRAEPLAARGHPDQACEVEFAQQHVRRADRSDGEATEAWSVCFEAAGPYRREILEELLPRFLASRLRRLLEGASRSSYPAWLRER